MTTAANFPCTTRRKWWNDFDTRFVFVMHAYSFSNANHEANFLNYITKKAGLVFVWKKRYNLHEKVVLMITGLLQDHHHLYHHQQQLCFIYLTGTTAITRSLLRLLSDDKVPIIRPEQRRKRIQNTHLLDLERKRGLFLVGSCERLLERKSCALDTARRILLMLVLACSLMYSSLYAQIFFVNISITKLMI